MRLYIARSCRCRDRHTEWGALIFPRLFALLNACSHHEWQARSIPYKMLDNYCLEQYIIWTEVIE